MNFGLSHLFFRLLMTLLLVNRILACFESCNDAFKHSLVSILGHSPETETELLAPFHSVIGKSRTNTAAAKKIDWICFAVHRFDQCSQKCPASTNKSLRQATVMQWNTICNASRQSPKDFTEYLACERKHIEKTVRKCNFVRLTDRMGLKNFCTRLTTYAQCYASVPFSCSAKANELWLRINDSLQKSYNILLELFGQHLQLPIECKQSMATTLSVESTTLDPRSRGEVYDAEDPKGQNNESSIMPRQTPIFEWHESVSDEEASHASTIEDYNYFQQTDEYKYFGGEEEVTSTVSSTTITVSQESFLDYWIDLEDPKSQTRPPSVDEMRWSVGNGGKTNPLTQSQTAPTTSLPLMPSDHIERNQLPIIAAELHAPSPTTKLISIPSSSCKRFSTTTSLFLLFVYICCVIPFISG